MLGDGLVGLAINPILCGFYAREFHDDHSLNRITFKDFVLSIGYEHFDRTIFHRCFDPSPIFFEFFLVDGLRSRENNVSGHDRSPYLLPPFAKTIWPVSQLASSEARNTATRAMSSGWPTRPSGVLATIWFLDSAPMTPAACAPSVSVPPGLRALTRIFLGPNSFESTRVKPLTALFDAT